MRLWRGILAPARLAAAIAFMSGPLAASAHARPLPVRAASAAGRIAYTIQSGASPSVVWTASTSGSGKVKLGPGGSPVVAPDGALVAANPIPGQEGSATSGTVVLYSTAGAAPVEVGGLPGEEARPLAFSPDSKYLAIELRSSSVSRATATARSGLAVLDLETRAVTLVARGVIAGVSFSPRGSDDELVFARYSGTRAPENDAPVNLYTWAPGDAYPGQMTGDGRDLYPVWGSRWIAFDHERLRGHNTGPEYQVWLGTPAGPAHRLTHIGVGYLAVGLVPVAFSGSGSTLLAEYQQQDEPLAYIVTLPSGRARLLTVRGNPIVIADGLSASGTTALVTIGLYQVIRLATVPIGGGRPRILASGALEPSWNE
jgi:hypothetical protein